MNILKKLMKKQDKSIYSLMKECTSYGKLNVDKFDRLLNPIEEGSCKINAAFLDQFGISEDQRKEQVPQILEVINDIYNDKISIKNLEKKLKEINFKTLNVIDEVRKEINNENYSIKTYETFKRLMYSTNNKEIFKFSIEMTALIGKCEELLDDYIFIGQYEEFSKYISFILCIWREKPMFLEALFVLLDESEDWGAINYGEMLMRNEDIMADIKNQRRILIGALSKNCIPMEVCFELASYLNIKKLGEIAVDDEELSKAFTQLYTTLFFDREPSGGILDFEDSINYLNIYLSYLKKCEIQESKFIGLKDIREFLQDKENKDEIVDTYDEDVYISIVNEAECLWNRINVIDSLRNIIKLKDKYIYEAVRFVKENKIFELIPDLEEMYLSGCNCFALEELLCEIGSVSIKNKIYEMLKKECSFRKNKNISHSNLFGEEYKMKEKIVHKMDILSYQDCHDYELMCKLIEDYSPEIRVKALEILKRDYYYVENNQITQKVKERLSDSPFYIRSKAVDICKSYNLKITNEEKDYILNKILEHEGNKNNYMAVEFEKSLNEIVN